VFKPLFNLLVLCAAVSARPAVGQVSSPSATVDATERRAVVEQIARLLEENYVFPDVAARNGAQLNARLAAGAFDDMTDPQAYAEALTRELQSVNRDKHMRVRLRPAYPASGAQADPGAAVAQQLREMRSRNFGFERVEHLDGNVGYLDLRYFAPPELAREMATAAMQFLSNSDAIIVDLRRNTGGSPELVQLLCSYFFDERTHLNSLYWRRGDRTQEFWTIDDLPGRRLPRVPLFVLTSGGTFSGAEEFTYNMQTRHRATIIGETTGGGANPGGEMPVNDRFVIFVPTGRAINPVTGTNWEGVGVKPDVVVSASAALDTALVRARAAARAYADAEVAREASIREALMRRLAEARTLIERRQITAAETIVSEALSRALSEHAIDERMINLLGYRQLQADEKALAIAIFKANVAAFPESANTYDSLGEAYMENGDRELAIQNYRRSLELDPNNANARTMLERLGSR
jgi:tetratricopeptide (TPR) repeat protein